MKQVSQAAAKAIATYSSKDAATDKAKHAAVDVLVADGVSPEMIRAPKKGLDRSFYESVCAAVVAGFEGPIRTLLAMDINAVPDNKKVIRKYWQQQIGSKVKDLRNALQRRSDSGDGKEKKESTLESRIVRDLSKYITQLQKAEGFKGDLVGVIKDMQSAIARIK
jgi:hypothetical protein